jgi:imidazolonepropionase-like amidohydrolase
MITCSILTKAAVSAAARQLPRHAGAAAIFTLCTTVACAEPYQRQDQILMQGVVAGAQTVAETSPRAGRADYHYNDRGRGDHIVASWTLDAAGVPIRYSAHGNDYYKKAVSETFIVREGNAVWQNPSERGNRRVSGEMFYLPSDAPPEFIGVLARALIRAPGHRLALLPSGEAWIESTTSLGELTQYRIGGLDYTPTPVWLDRSGRTAAFVTGWLSVLPAGRAPELESLSNSQAKEDEAAALRLAQQETHGSATDLVIRNARLFDPRDLTVTAGMSVLIRGAHIVRVAADADLGAPAGAQVIDAAARFLMPGLWDNHQHFSQMLGTLDLINGVTSARDMANDTDEFPKRVERFDRGTELGPRVFKAGIIDGGGPLAAPTKMLADTPTQAIDEVDWYAQHGYGQIKIYSSVSPTLVPLIADEAHARGLRVSGHVPAFMSARQFVEAGADEIQHMNFIILNFLADTVKDTRNMTRFTAVAEHAQEFGPENPQAQRFIEFLKRHRTVLDPTMNIFESLFGGDPTAYTAGLESIAPRLPAQVRRRMLAQPLQVPPGRTEAYRAAFPAMLWLLKALHDAGVVIIPGTDSDSGYMLIHELELYARAGISPAEVLRMATLTSARVVGADYERGVIAPGKLADMILVDGDPARDVADLRKVTMVIKGGHWYDPARIEAALGIAPR